MKGIFNKALVLTLLISVGSVSAIGPEAGQQSAAEEVAQQAVPPAIVDAAKGVADVATGSAQQGSATASTGALVTEKMLDFARTTRSMLQNMAQQSWAWCKKNPAVPTVIGVYAAMGAVVYYICKKENKRREEREQEYKASEQERQQRIDNALQPEVWNATLDTFMTKVDRYVKQPFGYRAELKNSLTDLPEYQTILECLNDRYIYQLGNQFREDVDALSQALTVSYSNCYYPVADNYNELAEMVASLYKGVKETPRRYVDLHLCDNNYASCNYKAPYASCYDCQASCEPCCGCTPCCAPVA